MRFAFGQLGITYYLDLHNAGKYKKSQLTHVAALTYWKLNTNTLNSHRWSNYLN